MTDREEAKVILETLQLNEMPAAARDWLSKRFVKLLLNSIGKPIR